MGRSRLLVFAFAWMLLVSGRTASADPVTISSGYLAVGGVQDVNSRGFLRAIGYDFTFDGYRLSWGDNDYVTQTVLAPVLPSPTNFGPIDGTSTIVGLTSTLRIDATPVDGGSSPFTLSGHLQLFDLATRATLFDHAVAGAGTATWQFITTPSGGRLLSGATYEFADTTVPEPTTMILIGTGLAGLLATRRRRPTTGR